MGKWLWKKPLVKSVIGTDNQEVLLKLRVALPGSVTLEEMFEDKLKQNLQRAAIEMAKWPWFYKIRSDNRDNEQVLVFFRSSEVIEPDDGILVKFCWKLSL